MKTAGVLALVALCSCGIDDRTVEVGRLCMDPPAGGLISDFSTARSGFCFPEICPGDEGSLTVSLGLEGPKGRVYAYRKPPSVALTLAPTGDLSSVSDATAALQVTVDYDATARDPAPLVAALALQLVDCVKMGDYVGVSFRLAGDLGTCPLRFTARFAAHGDDLTLPPCTLDDCYASTTIAAAPGVNIARVVNPAHDLVFLGLQWELAAPADGARTCSADFTIDDVRLIAGP